LFIPCLQHLFALILIFLPFSYCPLKVFPFFLKLLCINSTFVLSYVIISRIILAAGRHLLCRARQISYYVFNKNCFNLCLLPCTLFHHIHHLLISDLLKVNTPDWPSQATHSVIHEEIFHYFYVIDYFTHITVLPLELEHFIHYFLWNFQGGSFLFLH